MIQLIQRNVGVDGKPAQGQQNANEDEVFHKRFRANERQAAIRGYYPDASPVSDKTIDRSPRKPRVDRRPHKSFDRRAISI